MTTPSTIIVDVARHQNWYVATSKSLTGLFVAHQSLAVLFQEIPEVLFDCSSLKNITLHHCKLFVKKVPHKLDLEMLKDLKELIAVEKLMHKEA